MPLPIPMDASESASRQAAPASPVSIIIPTFNGSARIASCLQALRPQAAAHGAEILVIDDGSRDNTLAMLRAHAGVRVLTQPNAGPAAARNHGAREAQGSIILFTDDDCEPAPGWLDAMLRPFADAEVVGVKGTYRTRQRSLIARFVQVEYEDKYRIMAGFSTIDFIDTYSAAFRRDRFQQMCGYDDAFPVACAEDVELSFRMAARGWKMLFAPGAIVYHRHPETLSQYVRKKFKFAYWRVLAVRKNPGKGARDSHTPQLMKVQLLLAPALLGSLAFDLVVRPALSVTLGVLALFLASTIPFSWRAASAGLSISLLSPALLAARSVSQFLGVVGGFLHARKQPRSAGFKSG